MNNDNSRDPSQQADISKSQSAQQPTGQQDEAAPDTTSQSSDADSQPSMADYGSAEQADALTQNRQDVEGASIEGEQTKSQSGGFVGSDSQSDTSSELVEDEDNQAPDGN